MSKVKLSIPMCVFLMGFVTMLILSGTAKGESQWYSGTNNGELVRGQPVEINFDNPKYVSKVYIETGCESKIAIYGNIQFFDGFGDSQISVSKIPFSKVLCGDTINVVPDIKTTKVKLLMTQALPPPYGSMSQPRYKVSLTTWKVYAGDTPITTPTPTTTPTTTPTPTATIITEKVSSDGVNYWMWLFLLIIGIVALMVLIEPKTIPPKPELEQQSIPYYYRVLGLNKDSSLEEITDAYRRLVKIYHPDVGADIDTEKKFREIQKAYEVLSDPEKRAQYDGFEAQYDGFEAQYDGFEDDYQETISYEKGRSFEQYVINLFDQSYFSISDCTRDNSKHFKRKVESDQNPDLTMRYIPKNELFSIECKFRSSAYDDKVNWARSDQIENYRSYSIKNKRPVFVVIGLGGSPNNPSRMFCIPIKEAKYPDLILSKLGKYERDPSKMFYWKDGNLR